MEGTNPGETDGGEHLGRIKWLSIVISFWVGVGRESINHVLAYLAIISMEI